MNEWSEFGKMPEAYFARKCYFLLPTAQPGWRWVGKRGKTGEGCAAAGPCPWETAVSQQVSEIKIIEYQIRPPGLFSIFFTMCACLRSFR